MDRVQQFLSEVLPNTEPGFTHNPVQIDYAQSVAQALGRPQGQFHYLEADTGIGKSLAYLLTLADWWAQDPRRRKVVLATHSRALQQQLASEHNGRIIARYLDWAGLPPVDIRVRMGRANYVSHRRLEMVLGARRLEDVVGQKQRSKQERDLAEWALSSDGCLLDMEGIELPDDIALDDICLTSAEPLPDNVQAHFDRAAVASMTIINTAVLCNELMRRDGQIMGTQGKEAVLLIDEAEHFPDVAAGMFAKHISVRATARLARELGYRKNAEHWMEVQQALTDRRKAGEVESLDPRMHERLATALRAITRTPSKDEPASVNEAEWQKLRETARVLLQRLNAQDQKLVLRYSRVNGLPSLVRGNDLAGRCLKNGAKGRRTILTSATLSDLLDNGLAPTFRYIQGRIGVVGDEAARGLEVRHQARDFGRLSFRQALTDMPRPLRETEDGFELRETFARTAVQEILRDTKGRVLVLCASYADVKAISDVWPDADRGRLVTHPRGAAVNHIAAGLSDRAVLVTPAGWEGLSPQRGRKPFWSRVVLLRNPMPAINPVERYLLSQYLRSQRGTRKGEAEKRADAMLHVRLHTQTLHKIRQGIGRALRHPKDRCEILFLDPRFPSPHEIRRRGGMELGLAAAIPARFLDGYVGLGSIANEEGVGDGGILVI